MRSLRWYLLLLALVIVERCAELLVARRNARWSRTHGGIEYGESHYPIMVSLHTAFLVGCGLEPLVLDRPFLPWLGWPALGAMVAAQGVRWWCVATLGRRWNTRVIVVPGMPLVQSGPYRWLAHPNYAAVVVEGIALPLIHTAWITALGFTVANAFLLAHRVRVEDAALGRVS